MMEWSDANFPNPDIRDTVRVQIPDVDWAKTDAHSLLACVMERTEDNFYHLGTPNGVLEQLYSRSQFLVCHEKFIKIDEIPTDNSVSLHSVASSQVLCQSFR